MARKGAILDRRALNRALLERQLLLRRAPLRSADALERLVGLQAQAPLAPYVGLWSRLEGFQTDELATLLRRREAVRLALLRGTIHLVTARDALALRSLFDGVLTRASRGPEPGGKRLAEVRALLEERPRTRAELGPDALVTTLRIPTVQVTPRGLWGETGPAAFTTVEAWLGRAPDAAATPDEMVLRYLRAFGPATVADIRTWSGVSGIAEVVERLRPRLVSYGRYLDVPGAPLPDPDTPAPPRFLPEYDNVLLSHADRARINPHGHPIPLAPGNGARMGTFLVDGFLAGTWRIDGGRLRIEPFGRLARADRAALDEEGERLLAFATRR